MAKQYSDPESSSTLAIFELPFRSVTTTMAVESNTCRVGNGILTGNELVCVTSVRSVVCGGCEGGGCELVLATDSELVSDPEC